MADQYIAISGNVATGKTTIAAPLARELDVPMLLERPELNPWFRALSSAPDRWALAAESHFALTAALDVLGQAGGFVQERFPREHVRVFGKLRRSTGQLSDDELRLLDYQLQVIEKAIRSPDLVVWMRASAPALFDRVRQRDREGESTITEETLGLVNELYSAFFESWTACPVVQIDTEQEDPHDEASTQLLVERIRHLLGSN